MKKYRITLGFLAGGKMGRTVMLGQDTLVTIDSRRQGESLMTVSDVQKGCIYTVEQTVFDKVAVLL